MLTGADAVAVTKLDVLDSLETIPVCVAYELDGERVTEMPSDTADITRVVPVYEELPGWQEPTTEVQSWQDFPALAKDYLKYLVGLVDAKLHIVSVGPKRKQTLSVAVG